MNLLHNDANIPFNRRDIFYIILIFAFIAVGLFHHVFALDPRKEVCSYTNDVWLMDDGLPQNYALVVVQTPDGYIWIGTQEGLARFNGHKFEVFNVNNNSCLSTNTINSLAVDDQGTLWIGNSGGGLVSLKDGVFKLHHPDHEICKHFLRVLMPASDGSLWIGTDHGLWRLQNDRIEKMSLPGRLEQYPLVTSILEDDLGRIWVGTGAYGLFRLTRVGSAYDVSPAGFSENQINALLEDAEGNLWIGMQDFGLAHMRDGEMILYTTEQGLSNNSVTSLLQDRDGNIWIGTYGGGLNRFYGGSFSVFDSLCGLSDDIVSSLCEDREGNLWVGTMGGGLNLLKDVKIITYRPKHGLSIDMISAIFQDNQGDIWIGTDGAGVDLFHNGAFKNINMKDGLSGNKVISICQDNDGYLWFGTDGGGVTRFKDGEYRIFTSRDGLSSDRVAAVYQDKKGHLWIGTRGGGVNILSEGRFTVYNEENGLSYNTVNVIHEDSNGDMWLGTTGGGLNRLRQGKIKIFNKSTGFPSDLIMCVFEDSAGGLWIGTYGGGLIHHAQGHFTAIKTFDGLFDNVVYTILEDEDHNFWMSCNKGIFKVNRRQLDDFVSGKIHRIHCTHYGKSDGMISAECNGGNQPAGMLARDGTLWFPTIKGVAVVDPEIILWNPLPPPVVIERVVINGTSYPHQQECLVPPGKGELEIEYAGLSFVSIKKVIFRYRLDGYNSGWVEAGLRRTAFYTNLSPGSYEFSVIACNREGVWNKTGASFSFHLEPYFYQTIWFYILCGVFVILLVFGIIRFRIRQMKKKEKELIELVDQRTKDIIEFNVELVKANKIKTELLETVSHDLRNPLNAIAGFTQLIKSSGECPSSLEDDIDSIAKASNQMQNLIIEMLDSAVIEGGEITLEKETFDLSNLAWFVVEAYGQTASKKEQNLIISIKEHCMVRGDKGRLRDVMDNLLSNAVKFTPLKKNIWFILRKSDHTVRFEVKDEGPGLTSEDMEKVFSRFQRLSARPTGGESSTGLGLFIVKRMVELHEGRVWVESKEGKGSRFIVELPGEKCGLTQQR